MLPSCQRIPVRCDVRFKPGQRVRIRKAIWKRFVGRLGTVRGFRGDRYEVYLDDWGESSYFRASELESVEPTRQDSG